ncbi:hypothetical protein ANN_11022 [Periplaneta americana]|uniref:Mos1 transposase HTH domain-containing protein n=1 Tax=Periplaneta americana TaxID=6978 RepID=A0ABQ8T527_PERAM|nr:hypothetical protein ANN_11022 [Periplaneta americana]
MSPGSSTESYPAFAHIELRENHGKNLNQRNMINDVAFLIECMRHNLRKEYLVFSAIFDKILYDVNKSDIPRKLLQLVLSSFLKIGYVIASAIRHEAHPETGQVPPGASSVHQWSEMEALIPSPAACQVRSVIKFFNAQTIAPIEIHRQLCQVYGPNIMSKQMVRRWCRQFSEGRQSVHDEERS